MLILQSPAFSEGAAFPTGRRVSRSSWTIPAGASGESMPEGRARTAQRRRAMRGHALAEARLIGTYAHRGR